MAYTQYLKVVTLTNKFSLSISSMDESEICRFTMYM